MMINNNSPSSSSTTKQTPCAAASRRSFTLVPAALLFQDKHWVRWVVLIAYCFLNGVNNLLGMTFSTVVDQTAQLFGCSIFQVNMLDSSLTIVFGVTSIPLSFLFDRFGLRIGINAGTALNAVGAIGRLLCLLVIPYYSALFVFQMCIAVGMAFALGIPSLVSAAWFGANERGLATSIGNASGFVGMAVGYILSPAIVTEDATIDGGTNPSLLRTQFIWLLVSNIAMALFSLALSFFFVGDMPPVAPSVTARRREEGGEDGAGLGNAANAAEEGGHSPVGAKEQSSLLAYGATAGVGGGLGNGSAAFSEVSLKTNSNMVGADEGGDAIKAVTEEGNINNVASASSSSSPPTSIGATVSFILTTLKALFSNKSYLLLLTVITLSNGVFGGLSYLLAQVNQPFGVSNLNTGWMGCIGGGTSIVGCIMLGKVMDTRRKYKFPLVSLNFLYTFCLCATILSYAARWETVANAYVWIVLFNILQGCIASVAFEYAVELTYPLNEAISGTVSMAIPNMLNGTIVFVSSSLFGDGACTPQTAMYVFMGCAVMCAIATLVALGIREGKVRVGIEQSAGEGRK